MPLVEKLGSFYLGREYDASRREAKAAPVDYDSRDLTTHAVCVGMTGSGKTGLCIDLLEEAAIDGVPAIIVDPKGDITNLLLTFPDLRPEDFLPWINPDDAERAGQSAEAFAGMAAETWRRGLAEWDEGPERILMLKEAADFAIYTPGSEAGLPVSIVTSFKAPALDWEVDAETAREQVQGTVSALLGLIGVEADPLKSREYILLANIVEHAWRAGDDLDLPGLILAVQDPPFRKLGVFDLDTLFPAKDRTALALLLNNIIASPSFASWLAGEPLDIAALLRTPEGKPRHSIFYVAHLNDSERMFFVTLLLENLLGWMRAQPGTTSLRALFYMDEVFGFFPPIGAPPSKRLLLTLLKQGRAFGLGLLLATQNPADLDYKGLSNAGTWFVGKLQTERDKTRLMEGLLGALDENGVPADKGELEKTISGLENRVFLLHDVHAGRPLTFRTRWAMSYLRGPLTRQQIKTLMVEKKSERAGEQGSRGEPAAGRDSGGAGPGKAEPGWRAGSAGTSALPYVGAGRRQGAAMAGQTPLGSGQGRADTALGTEGDAQLKAAPPAVPAGIKQVHLPVTMSTEEAVRQVSEHVGAALRPVRQMLVYEAALLGLATVRFTERTLGFETAQDYACLVLLAEQGTTIQWSDGWGVALTPGQLAGQGLEGALYRQDAGRTLAGARNLGSQAAAFADYLYRRAAYPLLQAPDLGLRAAPREGERDFRARCQQTAREARDGQVDELAGRYQATLSKLQESLATARRELAEVQAEHQEHETLPGLSGIAGALGLFGRRSPDRSVASVAPAGSARAESATDRSTEVQAIRAAIAEVQRQMQAEATALTAHWARAATNVQLTRITPRKADVTVHLIALAWAGSWEITYPDADGQARTELVPAYPMG